MNNFKTILTFFILFITFIDVKAFVLPSSSKKTFVVDNNYGVYCKYRTVSAAISAASDGDTIYIMPSLTPYDGFTVNKSLYIYSQKNKSSNSEVANISLSSIVLSSRTCVLEGLQITSNSITINGNSTTINNCYISSPLILNSDSNKLIGNNFNFSKNEYLLFYATSNFNKIANNHIEKFQFTALSGTIYPFVDGADSSNQILNNIFLERENGNKYAPKNGFVFFKNSSAIIENNIFWSEIDDRAAFDTLAYNCKYNKNITYSRFNSPNNLQDTGNFNDTFVSFKFHDNYSHTIPFYFNDPDNFALKNSSIGKNSGSDSKDIGLSGGIDLYRAHGQKNNSITVENIKVPSKVINKDTLKLQVKLNTQKDTFACNNFNLYCATIDSVFYSFDTTFQLHEGNQKLLFVGDKSLIDTTLYLSLDSMSLTAHTLIISMRSSSGVWSYHTSELFNVKPDANFYNFSNVEYAFDTDSNSWNQVSFTPNDTIDMYFDVNIDNLPTGAHSLLVRTKLSNGLYSTWQMHPFYIKGDSLGDIEKLEYTFDKDTAKEKWTQIAISPSDSIDILSQINIDHLTLGHHALLVRTYIGSNLYSPWQMHPFFIKGDSLGDIEKLEYTFDKDTARDKWTQIAISPSDSIDLLSLINIDHLTLGHHVLLLRTYIGSNLYSPWQIHPIFIQDTVSNNKLISYTYSIDSSLHNLPYTFKKTITPSDSINTTFIHTLDTSLSYGIHYLRVWAQHSNTHNTTWHTDTFEIIDCPMLDTADFTISNNLCKGNSIKFKQDITKFGIWSKDSFNFNWYIDNTLSGTADSLLKTFSTVDTFNLKLSFVKKNNSKCKGEMTKAVIISQSNKDTTLQTICQNDSILVHGLFKKTAGTYIYNGTNKYGCDSISTFILNVNPSYTFRDTFTFCNGASITKHGQTFTTAGTYTNTFSTTKGCDSIWITKINVNPTYTYRDTFTFCSGGSITKHGQTFSTAGTYTNTFSTTKGCDSIWITKINVNPTYTYRDTFTFCSGGSITKHGQTFTSSGTYTNSYSTSKGCDSIWITKINVNPTYTYRDTFTLCQGNSISKHGQTFNSAGTYTNTFSTSKGCDSIWITKINVNPNYTFRDTFTFCNGTSITKHGQTFTTAGTYTNTFSTIKGCDSIWITKINVNPSYTFRDTFTICQGNSISRHGQTFTSSGTYTNSYSTSKGCDSIWITKINVNPTYTYRDTFTLCQGNSISKHGQTFSSVGTYTNTFSTIKGCDSIWITKINVNPSYTFRDTFTFCNGANITKHGQTFSTPGTYTNTFSTSKGCDSIWITKINVNPTYTFRDTFTFCNGASITKHGQTFTTAGTYTNTFSTIKGCDSIWITKINVNPSYTYRDTFTFCNGTSISKHGQTFNTAGTYTNTFSTIKGCDSIWITKINVNPSYTFRDTFTICQGNSIIKHGQTFSSAGTYTNTFSTSKGCDSIWITKINVNPTYNNSKVVGVCGGDSVLFEGVYRKTTGVYTVNYRTINGCDSIITLNLTVDNKIIVTLNPIICYGDSFLSGAYYKKLANTYYDTLVASKGCDSILITNLNIRTLDSVHIYKTICAKDTFTFFNQKLYQTGIYLHKLKNRFICDSFIYMHLNVRPLNAVTLNRTICNLDSVFTGNSWKKNSGTYIETLSDINGCDSIVTSIINVNPIYKYRDTLTLCQGNSISKHGQNFSSAGTYTNSFITTKGCDSIWITQVYVNPIYNYRDTLTLCQGNSITKHGQIFSSAGTYTNTFNTIKGCDSLWITNVIVNPTYTYRDTFSLCQGNSISRHGQTFNSTGIYTNTFNTTKGCDSIWITKINVNPTYNRVEYDTICAGENINFFGDVLTSSGKYLKNFNTQYACDSTIELNLFVRKKHQVIIVSTGFNQLTTDSVYSTYQWYLNRNILVGKTSRSITVNQQGTYDVSVTNQFGCTWTSWDNTSSIDDIKHSKITLYPNPANDWVKIDCEKDNLSLTCYDNMGRLVKSEQLNSGENTLEIQDLRAGVYYIHISGNGSYFSTKIVIIN